MPSPRIYPLKIKSTPPNTVPTEQITPLLDHGINPKDVEQAKGLPRETTYTLDSGEKNTGASPMKSSSFSGWSRKKKIFIVTLVTATIASVVSATAFSIYKLISPNGNNPNNTLAPTTDFTGNTVNPYLKNATSSYSKTVANSSTPSFDAALKSLKTDSDFDKNSSEFAEYNRSFTELEELELQEQSNSTLTSVNSYLENSMGLPNSTADEILEFQVQNNSISASATDIADSYIENSIYLSNSTYDESSEREPQAQEDNGRGRNRNRREKVTTHATTAVTPNATPKRYTLLLDSKSEPKVGAKGMQITVDLREISSIITPGLCDFIVDRFKYFNDMRKDVVLTLISDSSTASEYKIYPEGSNDNIDTDDVIDRAKAVVHFGRSSPPYIRAVKALGNHKYIFFIEGSAADQVKFRESFKEMVQRHDPKLAKFLGAQIFEYIIPNPQSRSLGVFRDCVNYPNSYRFKMLGYHYEYNYTRTLPGEDEGSALVQKRPGVLRFRVYSARNKVIIKVKDLCSIIKDRVLYFQSMGFKGELIQSPPFLPMEEDYFEVSPSITNFTVSDPSVAVENLSSEGIVSSDNTDTSFDAVIKRKVVDGDMMERWQGPRQPLDDSWPWNYRPVTFKGKTEWERVPDQSELAGPADLVRRELRPSEVLDEVTNYYVLQNVVQRGCSLGPR